MDADSTGSREDAQDARSGYETRMYIALTRATAEVAIVCTEAEVGQDERLAGTGRG